MDTNTRRVWLALAMSLASAAVAADVQITGTPAEVAKHLRPERTVVTLVGYSKQVVQADTATIPVTVKTSARDLASALAANGQRRAQIAESLQREGIAPSSIRNARFSTSPQFGWLGKTPASYEVTHQMEIRVRDERQLTAVARLGESGTDVTVGTVKFEFTDRDALIESVRQAAFDAAIAKKEFYEKRMGVTLRPTGFRYATDEPVNAIEGGQLEEIVVNVGRRMDRESDRANFSLAQTPTPFDDQTIEYWAIVTLESTTLR